MGHDQISQTIYLPEAGAGGSWDEGETHMFGTDGHGSVRVLYDLAGVIARDDQQRMQVYFYDAYGNLLALGGSSLTPYDSTLTTYLYSGEAFDFRIGQQYLRARWYDARTGRFDRLDPFAGNSQDPQSFHKYGYVHGDPIQGIDLTGQFFGLAMGIGGLMMTAAFSGGLRSEANKVYFQIFGDVSAEASQHFGGYWRTIQLFSLAGAGGFAGILGGRGMFQLLKSNGMLPSIQRGLAKMMPFLAKRTTDFLERGVILASREVFERLSPGGKAAIREAYALRATMPNSGRNVAAVSYSIKDRAGNWVSQSPIAEWSIPKGGPELQMHSESVLISQLKHRHGTNFRIDSIFSERVPCTTPGNQCALVLADQEKLQGKTMELIHFGIDPGSGSTSSIANAWNDLASLF